MLISAAQDGNAEYRSHMEDGHAVVDPLFTSEHGERWGYFAVYDGHGGRQAVDWCEAHLHERVGAALKGLRAHFDRPAVYAALISAFKEADEQLAQLGAMKYGCTATVAVTHKASSGTTLYVANVGDSRAVLVGHAGVKQVSMDHKATDASEAKRVAHEGGFIFKKRICGSLAISRSLGDHELKTGGLSCIPDIFSGRLTRGVHALVMASDGVWDVLDNAEVQDIVEACVVRTTAAVSGDSAQGLCDRLRDAAATTILQRAKERGSQDNIVVLVAFL